MNPYAAWIMKMGGLIIVYWTRARTVGGILVKSGLSLMAIKPSIVIAIAIVQQDIGVLSFRLENPIADALTTISFLIGTVAFISGAIFLVCDRNASKKAAARARIVAVEFRGLVETGSTPLLSAVPGLLYAQRSQIIVNVQENLRRGGIAELQQAVSEIYAVRQRLKDHCSDSAREDIYLTAAGVMPVALLFYAGHILEDISAITLMDWNRTRDNWQPLDEMDDGLRLQISGHIPKGTSESVLALSVSYSVDEAAIAECFPHLPVLHMRLNNPAVNRLWSEDKQRGLCDQFLEQMSTLHNADISTVHLILAAPSSLCLRLGRHYDFKNHPTIIAYEYHRGKLPAYQWGIKFAHDAESLPQVLILPNSRFGIG